MSVALIKTDNGGHDLEARRGSRETVAWHQSLILTECEYSASLAALLTEWGYALYAFACHRSTMAVSLKRLPSGPREP